MTKVLFMLSAVVMVVAIVVSYQNRQSLVDVRQDRITNDVELKKELANANRAAQDAKDESAKAVAINAEYSRSEELLGIARNKLGLIKTQNEALKKEYTEAEAKINKYKEEILELTKSMPPNFQIETATESMNTIRKEIADNKAQVEKIQEEINNKDLDVKKVQDQLANIVESIEVRKKSFDRNSMSAVIVAVNNDWGFVVIEGGQNRGLTTETKLLVVRGNEPVGRVKIVSVDSAKTLANVEPKSVNPGMSIMPGDRVILEDLYK